MSKSGPGFSNAYYERKKGMTHMPGSLMLLLALLAACRLAPRIAALLTAALATSIAFALCIRNARNGSALVDCAAAPHRLEGRMWCRVQWEQRLLERSTRDVLATAEFMTQYPWASARGKALADRLRKRGQA